MAFYEDLSNPTHLVNMFCLCLQSAMGDCVMVSGYPLPAPFLRLNSEDLADVSCIWQMYPTRHPRSSPYGRIYRYDKEEAIPIHLTRSFQWLPV